MIGEFSYPVTVTLWGKGSLKVEACLQIGGNASVKPVLDNRIFYL